jgi:hypothetical protein
MLSYEVSYLGIVVRVLGLVELQVQWIVEQVDLLLTYLGNDIQRLMVLVDQHVNYLVLFCSWSCSFMVSANWMWLSFVP